jgi:hypothetical protein
MNSAAQYEQDKNTNDETNTFQPIIQSINLNLQYLTLSLPNNAILSEDTDHIYKLCKEYIRIYEKTSSSHREKSGRKSKKHATTTRPEILNWRAR